MLEEDLEILIRKCCKGNTLAQRRLYDKFSPKLFAVCMRYSNCRDDAQDNFQEAFIKIFQKIDSFNGKGSFEGWMRRIMVNQCMDKFRKNRLTIVTDNPQKYQEHELDEDEDDVEPIISADALTDLIQQLPNQYRLVFNLYVIENYTHAEIAEQLNISIGTSKSNLSRAKSWLRDRLKKKMKTINIA